jgi:ATP-dependent helicase STH1/SNF2
MPAGLDAHLSRRVHRERLAKRKHVEQLSIICHHRRDVLAANGAAPTLKARSGGSQLPCSYRKEEQKHIERISKECLRAFKADDEEACMRLVGTAKNTRITHLLRQTDAYLDSLAQAVVAQQNETGPCRE